MNGDGFTPAKKQGDRVKKGDLLLEFDMQKIKEAGYPLTTPVIIANTNDYTEVLPTEAQEVASGDMLIHIL